MLKVGLIGAGFMGGMHAACYRVLAETGIRLAAVADLDEEKRDPVREKYGAEVYSSGMELIEKADVDIIDICLPTYLHASHAVEAMKKGRAVFIEKPVCIDMEEAELLLKTQKETGAAVMVGQCLRLWPEYMWLKETAVSGKYGKIKSALFKRLSPKPTWAWNNWLHKPECSGTVAMDLHIHDVDIARYVLGEPDNVVSFASRDKEGVIQQIFSTYEYNDPKMLSVLEGTWDYPDSFPFCMEYRVRFENATAVFDSTGEPSLKVYPDNGGCLVPEMAAEAMDAADMGGNISSLGGYLNELRYFTEKIASGEKIEVAPLEEGVRSLALVLKEIHLVGGMRTQV